MSNPTIEDALSEVERSYYYGLFQMVEVDQDVAGGEKLITLLNQSKLKSDILRSIWIMCVKSNLGRSNLTKLEFFKTMRAIALVQADVQYNTIESWLLAINFAYLPTFENIYRPELPSIPARERKFPDIIYPDILPKELEEYEDFINSVNYIITLVNDCNSWKFKGF